MSTPTNISKNVILDNKSQNLPTFTNNYSTNNERGQAIPLVLFQGKSYIIPPEAKTFLANELYKNIAIVSVVGKYRTGKSFLLNRILLEEKGAFKIGNTQKACTKGIWIYSKPKEILYNGKPMYVFFIDTEGLGAYDEEVNHDTKIFLVAILISSLFIFNSHGTIDENSINTLSFIINLSKYLKITATSSKDNTNSFDEYFPEFLWLLRDFSLRLVDKDDNPITTNQYLENALNLETNEEKTKIRKSIKEHFKNRDCFTLVRPVENEKDLQNLEELDMDKFRSEFLEQCSILRSRVFSNLTPKSLNGRYLTGSNLVTFLEDVITAVNSGAVPVIENSWKYMIESENMNNLKSLIKSFDTKMKEYYLKELDTVGAVPLNTGLFKNITLGNSINNNNLYNNAYNVKSKMALGNAPLINKVDDDKQMEQIDKEKILDEVNLFKDSLNNSITNNGNANNNNYISNINSNINNRDRDNEDSQTDSFLINKDTHTNNSTSNSIINQNLRLLKFNFSEFVSYLNKKKNDVINELLKTYLDYESTILSKDSEEYKSFEDKFKKSCDVEYQKFYEGEVELLIIRSFHERVEDRTQSLFNTFGYFPNSFNAGIGGMPSNNNNNNNRLNNGYIPQSFQSNINNNTTNNNIQGSVYKNFYKFILEVESLIDELDSSFPVFKNKSSIITNKIFVIIKKFYEDCISKEKSILEGELFQTKKELISIQHKLTKLEDELKQNTQDYREKVEGYHNQIIELKGSNSGLKEQVNILEEDKKTASNNFQLKILENEKKYEEKINNITLLKGRLEDEIKNNEHIFLSYKLQVDKQNSLNEQKITLHTKEIEELKERISNLNKEKNKFEIERDQFEEDNDCLSKKLKEMEKEKKDLESQLENYSNQNRDETVFNTNTNEVAQINILENNHNNDSNIQSSNNQISSEVNNINTNNTNNINSNNNKVIGKPPKVINNNNLVLKNSSQEIARLNKQNEYLKGQLENTKKIYDDIIKNLRSSLQEKNIEYLKELNNKKIVETNKTLSNTLKNYEDRCIKLEDKLKTYLNYKTVVKAASTFQCKECYKQYTFEVFLKHINKCKSSIMRQQQNIQEKIKEEKKINAIVVITTYIEKENKMELMIEITHKLQIWKILVFLDALIILNEKLRENYPNENFDFDYLTDNDITENYTVTEEKDISTLNNRLNTYLKALTNFEVLNRSEEFKEFVEFNNNYEELDNSVDQESALNDELLNNLENTLNMTMSNMNYLSSMHNSNIGFASTINKSGYGQNHIQNQIKNSVFDKNYVKSDTINLYENNMKNNKANKDSLQSNENINFNSTMYLLNNPLKTTVSPINSLSNINLYSGINIPNISNNNNVKEVRSKNFNSANFNTNNSKDNINENNISISNIKHNVNITADYIPKHTDETFWDNDITNDYNMKEVSRCSSKNDFSMFKGGDITPIRHDSYTVNNVYSEVNFNNLNNTTDKNANMNMLTLDAVEDNLTPIINKFDNDDLNKNFRQNLHKDNNKESTNNNNNNSTFNPVTKAVVDSKKDAIGNTNNNTTNNNNLIGNNNIEHKVHINNSNNNTNQTKQIAQTKRQTTKFSSKTNVINVINLNDPEIDKIIVSDTNKNINSTENSKRVKSSILSDENKSASKSNDYGVGNKVRDSISGENSNTKQNSILSTLELGDKALKKLLNPSTKKESSVNVTPTNKDKSEVSIVNDFNRNNNTTHSISNEISTNNTTYSKPALFTRKTVANLISVQPSINSNINNIKEKTQNIVPVIPVKEVKLTEKIVLKDFLSKTPPKTNTLINLINLNKDVDKEKESQIIKKDKKLSLIFTPTKSIDMNSNLNNNNQNQIVVTNVTAINKDKKDLIKDTKDKDTKDLASAVKKDLKRRLNANK